MENGLMENEKRPDGLYRHIFEESSQAMLYISSPEGQILEMNAEFKNFLENAGGSAWSGITHVHQLEKLGFPGVGRMEQGSGHFRFRLQSPKSHETREDVEVELFTSPVEHSGEQGLFCLLLRRPSVGNLNEKLMKHVNAQSPGPGDPGQVLYNGLEYCASLLEAESAAGVFTSSDSDVPGETLIWPPESMDNLRSNMINVLETADLNPRSRFHDLDLMYDEQQRQTILTAYIPGAEVTLGCMVFFLDGELKDLNGLEDDLRMVSMVMGKILERMETFGNLDTLIDTSGILRSDSDMGILVLDHEGKILETNRMVRQILSMEKQELDGRNFDELQESWHMQLPRIEGMELPVSYRVPGPSGFSAQIISQQVDLCGICSFEDSIGERIVFILDISSMKNLEKKYLDAAGEAQSAEVLKKTFISSISHEIRTPLNGINGMSQLLEDTQLDGEQENIVKTLRMAVGAMNRLVQDLLDLSRLETGAVEISKDFHVPGDAASDELEQFKSDARAKGLKLLLENKIPAIEYYGDEKHLRQVIRNLLSNAVKFTREGFVRLRCFRDRDVLSFQVEDSGPGLDGQQQETIFKTFVQLDSRNTSFRTGLGLGLPLARRLAALMDGRLTVESVPGKGSTFTLQLPAQPNLLKHTRDQAQQPDTEERPLRFQGLCVIVAEDDPINRSTITRFLKMQGCEVHTAVNGSEAEYLIRRHRVDLAVLDVSMPQVSGLELTAKIRSGEIGGRQDLPVLGVTGHGLPEEVDSFLKAGMNDVLLKPFVTQHLYAKMDSLLVS